MTYRTIIKNEKDLNEILKKESLQIKESLSDDEIKVLNGMMKYIKSKFTFYRFARRTQPTGLAAPQVGILKRMIVFKANKGQYKTNSNEWATKDEFFALYNPEIIKKSAKIVSSKETCLSVNTLFKDSVCRHHFFA